MNLCPWLRQIQVLSTAVYYQTAWFYAGYSSSFKKWLFLANRLTLKIGYLFRKDNEENTFIYFSPNTYIMFLSIILSLSEYCHPIIIDLNIK